MLRGSCSCGAVRYEADGPPLFFAHCHCRWCRRAHGAGFVSWVGVPEGGFRLVSGDALRWYASSARSRRAFCGTCGSTLLFASAAAPGEVHLAAGNVDEGLDGLSPTAHVFVEQKAPWIHIGDALPQRTEDAPGLAAYRGDPRTPT